jgi:hypothetical protein
VARVLSTLSRLRWSPHRPTAKQLAFLSLECREALYGGAAGGGKSDALLMAALEYADVPDYAALLLRRTFADLALPGALMDRAHQWLAGSGATWDGQQHRWTFPSGATLSFGYLDASNDHYRYQSSEFQFVGFDELTQFQEHQYRYLFSRLRRLAGSDVPLRMRAGSNPGGVGHQWVFGRFIAGGNTPDRVFLPATLDENPHLDREAYDAALSELDDVERERLRRGNWHVRRKGLVYPDLVACAVPVGTRVPGGWSPGGIDWGFNNPFAALRGSLDHDDVLWVWWERYGRHQAPSEHARHLPEGVEWWADPAGADQIAEVRKAGHRVRPCVHIGQQPLQHGIALVNRRIRTGRLKVVESCRELLRESGLYHYDKDTETPVDRDNHALSALRYLVVGIDRNRADIPAERTAGEINESALELAAEKAAAEAEHRDPFNDHWFE